MLSVSSNIINRDFFEVPKDIDQPYKDFLGILHATSASKPTTYDDIVNLINSYSHGMDVNVTEKGYSFTYGDRKKKLLSKNEILLVAIDSLYFTLQRSDIQNSIELFRNLGANPAEFLTFYSRIGLV